MTTQFNNSQPKLRLVSPLEKAGRGGETFTIARNDGQIFLFQYFPDFVFPVFGAGVLLLLSLILLLFKSWYAILCLGGLIYVIIYILSTRDLESKMDKRSGMVFYIRGGFLSGSYDRQETQFPISEIQHIVLQRHMSRYYDKFQVQLRLHSGKLLPISGMDLSFVDCQDIAQKVCAFLEFDPSLVKAID